MIDPPVPRWYTREVSFRPLFSAAFAFASMTAACASGTTQAMRERPMELVTDGASTHPRYGAPSPRLAERMDAVARAFQQRGGHPTSDRWLTFLPPEGVRTLRVTLDRPQCLGFVAIARESFGDIDIDLRNASAVRINQDNRNNAHPYVRACGRAHESLYVLVRAIRGAGEVGVLTVVDPPLVPPDLDAVLGVHNTASFTPPRTPRIAIGTDPSNVDAAHALDRVVQHFTPLGYRAVGTTITGSLDAGRQEAHPVQLLAGHCYAIIAAGGPGVDDLDMRLLSPTGRALAQDDATDNHPVLRTCPTSSGRHEVQVRMYSGAGDFALAVLALDPPVELPADMIGRERANTLELTAEGRRHGMALMFPAQRAGVVPSVPFALPVELRSGRCYLFGAAASESLAGIDLSLVDDHGAIVASDTATREVAHIWHCPMRSQHARVEVRGAGGRGEFGIVALESAHSSAEAR